MQSMSMFVLPIAIASAQWFARDNRRGMIRSKEQLRATRSGGPQLKDVTGDLQGWLLTFLAKVRHCPPTLCRMLWT
jgi:hypothetical protein